MNRLIFKIIFRTALACASAIIIYEVANQMLIYRYIKYDSYLAVVALIALVTGFVIAKSRNKDASNTQTDAFAGLTNKELYILQLISEGKSNKEIAAMNFVELSTIKTHINNLYTKLNVNNRRQAIEVYRQCYTGSKSTLSPPTII